MSKDQQGCRQKHVTLTAADLPLSCPTQDERTWDAHPRVYLPIEQLGEVVCPYCETTYVLEGARTLPPAQPADVAGY